MSVDGVSSIFRSRRAALATAFLFSGVINLLMLVIPLYSLQVFENVVPTGSLETLLSLTFIAGVAVIATVVLEAVRDRILARTSLWLDFNLGSFVLERSLRLGATAGGHTHAERDALAAIRAFSSGPAMGALFDMPWTPMFLAVLFLLHPLLGAVGIVSAGLLIAAALLQAWSSAGLQVEAAQAQSRADGWWRASADNVERTAAAGIAPVVSGRWADFAVKAASVAYAAAARGYLIKALAKAIRLLSQIAIFGAGALVVINHEASPGILVAGSILMGRALAPIEQSLTLLRLYVIARRSARGLKVLVMPAVRGLGSNDAPPKGIVSVKDAAYAYPGRSVLALRGVSLDVQPGEAVGIVGPNGSGKSTLAALLAGVMDPRSGSVELDGVPLTEWQRTARKACVGYLPQRSILFAGTVQENIVRFSDDGLLTASQAGMRAGVHEIISDLPQGYQTIVADDGANLAPHETRAIELARAVQKPVRLAILDEPDAGLDGVSERRLMRVLSELKAEGITLVIATQQPRLLAIADRVVVLKQGMIEMQGPAREVLQRLAQSRGAHPAAASLPAPTDAATAPAPQVVRAVS